MNNSSNIIEQIKESLKRGEITVNDIQGVLRDAGVNTISASQSNQNSQSASKASSVVERNYNISKTLYSIGGLIVLIGVIILLTQNWDTIGLAGRLLFTLGISLVTYFAALYSHEINKRQLSSSQSIQGSQTAQNSNNSATKAMTVVSFLPIQVYFVISAILFPLGLNILLSEFSFYSVLTGSNVAILLSMISGIVFTSALFYTKKPVLHVVVGIFSTIFVYSVVAQMVRGSLLDFSIIKDLFAYTSMVIAIGYFVYANWLKTAPVYASSKAAKIFTFASFTLFLGSALFLSGIWNVLYALLLVGAVSLSVKIRSTSSLVISSVAIVAYVIKISVQYFSNNVSWSLMLVLIGFLIIGLGYVTYYLNKKYINNEKRQG